MLFFFFKEILKNFHLTIFLSTGRPFLFNVNGRKSLKKPRIASDKRRETVTRTFRINAEWDRVLREESERQGISVNVLMNLILRRYANFDRLCRDSDTICLSKLAFRKMIENMPLEHMALAGEQTGSKDIQNMMDMLGLPSNYDSFISLIAKHYGGPDCAMWFNCFRHYQQKHDFFHLQHHLGREWSVYLEKYVISFLKTLKISCETRIYDYAVNIRVLEPH